MNCSEAVYSEDYYDLLRMTAFTIPGLTGDFCVQGIDDEFSVLYLPREGFPPLSINAYTYSAIPNCYTLLDQQAMETSGITRVQNQPALSLRGQGVLVGLVDTGIDYQNSVFRNSDGTTRILRIWDQTIEGGPPEGFIYGTEYTMEEINQALADDTTENQLPHRDTNGHGTFMAGIAAGNEVLGENFTGAAPDAQIVMVKLKPAKQYLRNFYYIPEKADAFQENDIMAGVAYLVRLAQRLNRPMAICLGLGTNSGDHSGGGVLPRYLANVATIRNITLTVAAGNEVNARHHYYGEVTMENAVDHVEINVEENVPGFHVELWAKAPELYSVRVISPTGERVPSIRGSREGVEQYRFVFENTILTIDYRIVGVTTGDQLIYMSFQNPARGIWTLEVSSDYQVSGHYHIWLPITGLIAGDITFIRSNPDTTITEPGNAGPPMTVAGYNSVSGSIYVNSSRGYTADGRVKPDFAAPGVEVLGPAPGGRFVRRTGSSVAAAITVGASALFLEWAVVRGNSPLISTASVQNELIRGANRVSGREYPNREWGYGTLNLYQSFEQMRRK